MNITIRKMQSSDADALYRLLSDPEVMRCLEPPYNKAQAEAFLRDWPLSRSYTPLKRTTASSAM